MRNSYECITEYLNYLQLKNVHICIKDFCGFIPINQELDAVLRPYLAHTNPFCMYIKQEEERYRECLSLIRRIYHKCEHGKGCFYGMCHAGLGEYVIPISLDQKLLGTINVGFFQFDETRTRRRIRRACAKSHILAEEDALKLYGQHIITANVDIEELLIQMRLLAGYLTSTYKTIQTTMPQQSTKKTHYISSEDTIITHTIAYIRQNYMNKITVSSLSGLCHCSESYLSRIFKKRTGLNINMYINKVRIEYAKELLIHTSKPLSHIALDVGFNDPNYFSRIFTQLIGNPPSEYRRRFQTFSGR